MIVKAALECTYKSCQLQHPLGKELGCCTSSIVRLGKILPRFCLPFPECPTLANLFPVGAQSW